MSIAAQIEDLVRKGMLIPFPRPVSSSPRHIFMSEDVETMIARSWEDSDDAELFAGARVALESFVRNNWMRFRWDPDEAAPANLARVKPVSLYVIDFRTKGPDGGIRIFGCFAQKDQFVALMWEYRKHVDWDLDPPDCVKMWTELFHSPPPNLGNAPNDYLSSNYSIARAQG